VERPAILTGTFQSVDRLETVKVGITLEAQLLHEADGDTLVDQIVLGDTNPQFLPRDFGEIYASPGRLFVAIVFMA
jgi:hypothetical protein